MVRKEIFGQRFESNNFGDLHVHSSYASGSLVFDGHLQPERLVELGEERGLSFIAITDHDTIVPSEIAKNHAARRNLKIEVVTAAEHSSKEGHILGLNIQDNIPYWLSAEETIRRIHRQGGFAIAAHPLYRLTDSVGKGVLRRIAQDEDPEIYWDGVEVFNASANSARGWEWFSKWSDGNRRARRFYDIEGATGEYGIATAGSDSHFEGLGRSVLVIPEGKTIYEAIREKTGRVEVTDIQENITITGFRKMNRKSSRLEQSRHTIPGHTFPPFVAGTIGA